MAPLTKSRIAVRIPQKYDEEIKKHHLSRYYNMTDFITDAIREKLQLDKDSDMEMIATKLTAIQNSNYNAEKQREISLTLLNQFIEYFFLYNDELDRKNLENIIDSAGSRHQKFIKRFKDELEDPSQSLFNKLFRNK